MKHGTDGISLLRYAQKKSRLMMFNEDGRLPAHDALGRGFFCARKDNDVGIEIRENEADALEYLRDAGKNNKTSMLVFVKGNGISDKFMHRMCGYNLPTFLPYDHKSLVHMVSAAMTYSRICKSPCVVYASRRLLTSHESYRRDGKCRDSRKMKLTCEQDIDDVRIKIETECTENLGDGKTVILTADYGYQFVRHIIEPGEIRICNLGLVYPINKVEIPSAGKYVSVGPIARYLAENLIDCTAIEPAENPLDESEKIQRELREELDEKYDDNSLIDFSPIEVLCVKRPSVHGWDNKMCEECIYRREELKILKEMKLKQEDAYEDIFCERLETEVSSGVANAANMYEAKVIFVNHRGHRYSAEKTKMINAQCARAAKFE